jgi:hypothetical protein
VIADFDAATRRERCELFARATQTAHRTLERSSGRKRTARDFQGLRRTMMAMHTDLAHAPTPIGPLTARALDRAAVRRAFGTSLLAAWRTLGRLLARDDRDDRVGRDALDEALQKVDAVRCALVAMRDATSD